MAARDTGIRLPRGRHFAVTWSIPDDFGGMTSAMLQRSAAFARLAGADVDVLTFDDRTDTAALAQRLHADSHLADGVHLRNLYEWLRAHPLPGGSLRLDRDAFTPLADDDDPDPARADDGTVLRRRRTADDGTVLQVDHYRLDGTLVLSDRRDVTRRGTPGGRSVVLCDAAGTPVRSWRRIHHLYAAWLDALTAGAPSYMLVDSKAIAKFMVGYRRRHVATVLVVHGSHRPLHGDAPVDEVRREVFARLHDFDAVALLTEAQRADVRALVGPQPHLIVVPNAVAAPETAPAPEAERSGAIVLSRLSALKNVGDAVAAVQQHNASGAAPTTLDIYGTGGQRDVVAAQVGADALIRLHGHDPAARERLARASVLLSTSRSEGFGLALVEAMAAGCLPIAYDVRYGPADLITDGVDGRLVPDGDIGAMAAALAEVGQLDPADRERMRAAARRRAADFSDERVTARWAHELRATWARKQRRRVRTGIRRRVGAAVRRLRGRS